MAPRSTFIAALLLSCQIAFPNDDFDKGTWSLELSGSYTDPVRFSENRFYNSSAGVNYYVADQFSLGVQLEAYYTEQPSADDAVLGGAALLMRWHVLQWDRFTLFLDAAGSATIAGDEVPAFGTHFNWTGKVGVGATWRLDHRLHLIAGARYFHLSNANRHGRIRNPSYDGVQYWAGVMWSW